MGYKLYNILWMVFHVHFIFYFFMMGVAYNFSTDKATTFIRTHKHTHTKEERVKAHGICIKLFHIIQFSIFRNIFPVNQF